jgi:hypothetical protein
LLIKLLIKYPWPKSASGPKPWDGGGKSVCRQQWIRQAFQAWISHQNYRFKETIELMLIGPKFIKDVIVTQPIFYPHAGIVAG